MIERLSRPIRGQRVISFQSNGPKSNFSAHKRTSFFQIDVQTRFYKPLQLPRVAISRSCKNHSSNEKALIRLFLPDSCLISLSRPLSGRKTLIRGHGFVESLACHEQRECSSSFVLDVVQHSGALISSSGSCTHVGSRPPPPL